MRTIGLGNALVDVLLPLENDSILSDIGIQKGGMEMIDEKQMLRLRESQNQANRRQAPGGSVCNTMRAMACLGSPTGFIGKIGTDAIGRFYEEVLLKAGVTPYFIKTDGISGSCTVFISPDGERTMGTFLGPAPDIKGAEITEEMLAPYGIIYIEGYLLVNEELVRSTMQKAKKMGIKVALDLSNFNIVNAFHGLLSEIIPEYVDILFSNESEAEAFTGQSARQAVDILSRQVEVSLVTLGKEGALIGHRGNIVAIPAEEAKPIDTTGAGDHFAAGFLYGYSAGSSFEQAARIGSILAGEVIQIVGAQIPDEQWEQIKLKTGRI